MSTPYTVHFGHDAWAAVAAQIRYIAIEKEAPLNAARWSRRLLDTIDSLSDMPERHIIDKAWSRRLGTEVRRMTFERTYVIYYTVNEPARRVDIVLFRHGAEKRDR